MKRALKCVFLDVGGVLWPDPWPDLQGAREAQLARLRLELPSWPERRVRKLHARLITLAGELTLAWTQDTAGLIERATTDLGLALDPTRIEAVRQAMCLPARDHVSLNRGAIDLAGALVELGLEVGVLTNAAWRGAGDYGRDFIDLGLGARVGAIVTSFDAGLRKPHPAIFARAVELAGCTPEDALMIGDSERDDIEPARAMGYRTIRFAVDPDDSVHSVADEVADSLEAVAALAGRMVRSA